MLYIYINIYIYIYIFFFSSQGFIEPPKMYVQPPLNKIIIFIFYFFFSSQGFIEPPKIYVQPPLNKIMCSIHCSGSKPHLAPITNSQHKIVRQYTKSLMKFTVYLIYLSPQKDKEGTNTTFEIL